MSSSILRTWISIMQSPTIPTKFVALRIATKTLCKIPSIFGVNSPIKLVWPHLPCPGWMIMSITWVPPPNVVCFLRKIIQQFIPKSGIIMRRITSQRFLRILVRIFWNDWVAVLRWSWQYDCEFISGENNERWKFFLPFIEKSFCFLSRKTVRLSSITYR